MLTLGGENVAPIEVVGYLLPPPAVHPVSVVGYPDPRLTEIAVAFVQLKPGANITSEDIIASCKGRIASFKLPRHVLFVENFPMTASGKVQKIKLRAQAKDLIKPS